MFGLPSVARATPTWPILHGLPESREVGSSEGVLEVVADRVAPFQAQKVEETFVPGFAGAFLRRRAGFGATSIVVHEGRDGFRVMRRGGPGRGSTRQAAASRYGSGMPSLARASTSITVIVKFS